MKGAMLVLSGINLDNSILSILSDHFQNLLNLHMIAKSCWVLVLVVNSATTKYTTYCPDKTRMTRMTKRILPSNILSLQVHVSHVGLVDDVTDTLAVGDVDDVTNALALVIKVQHIRHHCYEMMDKC